MAPLRLWRVWYEDPNGELIEYASIAYTKSDAIDFVTDAFPELSGFETFAKPVCQVEEGHVSLWAE